MVQIQNADECKKVILQSPAYRWITLQYNHDRRQQDGEFFDTKLKKKNIHE